MRNHVRKFILGVSLVAVLAMTAPAMAAARDSNAANDIVSRFRHLIVRILEIVEVKTSLPPG